MICDVCHKRKAEVSAIVNGSYYKNLCKPCKAQLSMGQMPNSGHARWARDIDLQDHEADIQQPWGKDGKPNAQFIRLYPKQAAAVFTKQQMRDASR